MTQPIHTTPELSATVKISEVSMAFIVCTISGNVNITSIQSTIELLQKAIDKNLPYALILDMTEVESISNDAVSLFLLTFETMANTGGIIVLSCLSAPAQKTLQKLGFIRYFIITPSVQEAKLYIKEKLNLDKI